jgi:hypothetical protein
MNGLTHLEPDYSEFVEVDPTGRYGRVYLSLSLSLSLSRVICFESDIWVPPFVAVQ